MTADGPNLEMTTAVSNVMRAFGPDALGDPRRIRAGLTDELGAGARARRAEIDAVVIAAEEGIAGQLVSANFDRVAAMSVLAARGLNAEVATYAIEVWRHGLGLSDPNSVAPLLAPVAHGLDSDLGPVPEPGFATTLPMPLPMPDGANPTLMGSRTSSGTRWNRTRWRVASGVLTTAIAVIAVMAVRTAGSTDVGAVSAGTELNTAAPATSTTTSSTVAPTTVAPTVTSAPETTVAPAIPQPTTPVTTPTTPKSGTPKTGTPKVGSPTTPVATSPPATTPTATAPPNRAPSVNTAYANPSSKTLSGNYAYWDIWLLNDAFVDADGDTWVLYSAGNGQYGTAAISSCPEGGSHKCVRYQPSAANQGKCGFDDQISVRAWDPNGSNNSSDVLRINVSISC